MLNFRIGEQLSIYWNSNNFVFLYVLVNMNLHHLDVNIVIYEDVSISIRMRRWKGEVSIPDKSLLLFLRPLSSTSLLHFQTNSINWLCLPYLCFTKNILPTLNSANISSEPPRKDWGYICSETDNVRSGPHIWALTWLGGAEIQSYLGQDYPDPEGQKIPSTIFWRE